MWTKKDRVLAVLSGEKPDRVPIFECVAHDAILEHFGKSPIQPGDRDQVIRACAQFLDLCHPPLVPNIPARIEHANGIVEVRERWNSWNTPLPYGDGSQHVESHEKAIAECQAWRPDSDEVTRWRAATATTNQLAGDMVLTTIGTSVSILPLDLEQGSLFQADYPELSDRWNHATNERMLRRIESIADSTLSPVVIVWNDIAAKGGLLYPPPMLEKLFYPYLAQLADLLHGKGIKLLFHCDGDATAALPRLIACGIDGFNPLEISSGMMPKDYRDACAVAGRKVALVGGIDAVDILARGTPADVIRETKALIDLFRQEGNLMIASASGEIDNSMPLANVLAMYETTWKYGNY